MSLNYFCNRGRFYRVHCGQMQAHVKFKLSATLTQLLSLFLFLFLILRAKQIYLVIACRHAFVCRQCSGQAYEKACDFQLASVGFWC